MPRIISVATALPPNRCDQSEMREAMARVCRGDRVMERLLPVFDRTGVETRHLVRPLEWYASGQTFEARNEVFAECGLDLVERAARTCLETSGVTADQKVTLRFKLDAAGSAMNVSLVHASDNALGASAVDALRAAAPFPPIPDEARCLARRPITATFTNPVAG